MIAARKLPLMFLKIDFVSKVVVVFLLSITLLVESAAAQSFNCAAGRVIYAKKYTDLIYEYPGTATVVEGCSTVCEQEPEEKRLGCFTLACGLGCLTVGMQNCMDYFTLKNEINNFRDGIEKICVAESEKNKKKQIETDRLAWSLAATEDSVSAFRKYIEQCNEVCAFRDDAENRLYGLQIAADNNAWERAKRSGTAAAAQEYLDNCGNLCSHSQEAERIVQVAKVEMQKRQAEVSNTIGIVLLGVALMLFEPNIVLLLHPQTYLLLPAFL